MKCATHPEVEATAYCRNCGKALCPECTRDVKGMFYCEPCLAALVARPAAAARVTQHAPAAAFGLGFIPGLGAVYNGEYTKALIHVAIFIGLVTLDSTGMHQPLFGLLTAAFCVYMPVEAFITAKRLHDEQAAASCVAATPAGEPGAAGSEVTAPPAAPLDRRPRLIGPVILILLGLIFLGDSLGWMDADRVFSHGWPVILIAVGIFMIVKKTSGGR